MYKGGGGGAGGLLSGTMIVTPGNTLSFLIGAGGVSSKEIISCGANTSALGLTAIGGGGGLSGRGGSGTPGQGNDVGRSYSSNYYNGGGGHGGNSHTDSTAIVSVAGTNGLGGGGGGGFTEGTGAVGGSGVVIVRYVGPKKNPIERVFASAIYATRSVCHSESGSTLRMVKY